jgi:hypothetical protein
MDLHLHLNFGRSGRISLNSCAHFTSIRMNSKPSQLWLKKMARMPLTNITCECSLWAYLLASLVGHPSQMLSSIKPESHVGSLKAKAESRFPDICIFWGLPCRGLTQVTWSMPLSFDGAHPRLTFRDEVPDQRVSRAAARLIPLSTAKEIPQMALLFGNIPPLVSSFDIDIAGSAQHCTLGLVRLAFKSSPDWLVAIPDIG